MKQTSPLASFRFKDNSKEIEELKTKVNELQEENKELLNNIQDQITEFEVLKSTLDAAYSEIEV